MYIYRASMNMLAARDAGLCVSRRCVCAVGRGRRRRTFATRRQYLLQGRRAADTNNYQQQYQPRPQSKVDSGRARMEAFFKQNPQVHAHLRQQLERNSRVTSSAPHQTTTRSGTPPPTAGAQDYYLTWLETQLMHGLRMESKTTFRVVASAVFLGSVLITVAFWKEIKQFFVGQTSEVAGTVLSAEDVQVKASDFAKAVLNQIMTDPVVYQRAITFLQKILQDPETQKQLQNLVSNALESTEVRTGLYDLLENENTVYHLKTMLVNIVHDESTQRALLDLLLWLVQQQTVKVSLQELLVSLFRDQHLVDEGSKYLTQAVHQTLSDEGVKRHAVHFVNSALTDEALHKQGGDALWKAFTYSISPRWFSKDAEEGRKVASAVPLPPTSGGKSMARTETVPSTEEGRPYGNHTTPSPFAASPEPGRDSYELPIDTRKNGERKPRTESLVRIDEAPLNSQVPSLPGVTGSSTSGDISKIQKSALEKVPQLAVSGTLLRVDNSGNNSVDHAERKL
eukprot:gb/GECG01011677.1/.p1 GENE.gb/GECG01011677.1/~~gb/GECG01011677.1/.p1  ORF type:complete len:510 (+),score=64.59 gb/GECG01011677.1/:1-1530(+)